MSTMREQLEEGRKIAALKEGARRRQELALAPPPPRPFYEFMREQEATYFRGLMETCRSFKEAAEIAGVTYSAVRRICRFNGIASASPHGRQRKGTYPMPSRRNTRS